VWFIRKIIFTQVMARFYLLFFLSLLSFLPIKVTTAQSGTSSADTLLFVIRVDDILSRNTTYRPSSIRPFQDMADEKGVPVTWGVMPNRFLEPNVNQGEMTRDLKHAIEHGHEVALHGYTHICQRCGHSSHEMYCTTYRSPFSYQQQLKLITDGLKILSDSLDMRPTSFIPPGHTYDQTTLQVLNDQHFDAITVHGEIEKPSDHFLNLGTSGDFGWEINTVNYTIHRTNVLRDIRQRGTSDGIYTLLLHDPFIRAGYLDGMLIRWTAEVIDSVRAEYGAKVRFVTLKEAANIIRSSPTSSELVQSELPNSIQLGQNYPNPFNPTTQIPFSLHNTATITIRILDLSGRILAEPISNRVYPAGQHSISINASNLASGLYLYTLTADTGYQLTKTMLLVK
jgi:predicted deacetylase